MCNPLKPRFWIRSFPIAAPLSNWVERLLPASRLQELPKAQTAVTDTDILNFALNLEYLEAEYYTIATSGMTIDQMGIGITGTGTQGGVTVKNNSPTSAKVPFATPAIQSYAQEVATEERKHVSFCAMHWVHPQSRKPAIDLLNSFNGLAVAAGIGSSFDPFSSEVNFLLGSYIFEDVASLPIMAPLA